MKKYSSILIPGLFFGLWFIIVFFFAYKDYGVPADELLQRGTGGVSAKYIVSKIYPAYVESHPEIKNLPDLLTHEDKDYGVGFELPAVILEKAFGFKDDSPEMIGFRHRLKFLLFFFASIFFFDLLKKHFQSWKWALLAIGMIVFFPRIFADSIYNSKDGVFLSACMISLWAMIRFLNQKSIKNAFIFALAAGYATDIRILGILFPLIAFSVTGFEIIAQGEWKTKLQIAWKPILVMWIGYFSITTILWPWLWENPVGNFLQAFENMAVFSRYSSSYTYLGETVKASELPWHYLPVWLGITIPIFVLAGFFIGTVAILVNTWKHKLKLYVDNGGRSELIFLGFTLLPLILAILKNSILYDGWRHFYFVYATLAIVATVGFKKIHDSVSKRVSEKNVPSFSFIFIVLLLFQFGWLGIGMVRNHPYQCVYFNAFAGSPQSIEKNFVLDYWGLSYPEMLQKTADLKGEDSLKVTTGGYPGILNLIYLNEKDRGKIILTEKRYMGGVEEAAYFVGFNQQMGDLPACDELAAIYSYGIKINNVAKRR